MLAINDREGTNMSGEMSQAVLESRVGGAPNKDALARELFEQQEALHNFHHKQPEEIALMAIIWEENWSTDLTLSDELKWRGEDPDDEEMIRNSKEWETLLGVLREDGTLVREHDRKIRDASRSQVGKQFVADEVIQAAGLYWRDVTLATKRRVLRARTTHRGFTVDLNCPDNFASPRAGTHVEISCDLGGIAQSPGFSRFVLHGPDMKGKCKAAKREWIPEIDPRVHNEAFTAGWTPTEGKQFLADLNKNKPQMFKADLAD